MDLDGSRDLISDLPEALVCHILSFLPTKEAASTSVLAKKWRYLFALTSTLQLVTSTKWIDQWKFKVSPSFFYFVDRLLALQGNSLVHKFSLEVKDGYKNPVDFTRIVAWILNVLERGVSDLDLNLYFDRESLLPSEIFLSKTLVRMKLVKEDRGCCFGTGPTFDVKDAYLPKLKTLCLDLVYIKNKGVGLVKLLSGCHMLEDLVLKLKYPCLWDYTSVSVSTLKRLRFCSDELDYNPKSVSFDTPNLVYLEYTDTIADKYPKLNFGSLVEAEINLWMSERQKVLADLREGHEENELISNATDFIIGICNVKILYLSADTLQVLTHCCEAIPVFSNLTHLTIENNPKVGWQSLPRLLMNSPNLETLVFDTFAHKTTNGCGVMCLCKPYKPEEASTCLSSSPVKVLNIKNFTGCDHPIEKQIELVKHFLEKMPNLEQLIIYYVTPVVEDVIELSRQLDNVASSKCIVRISMVTTYLA